MILTLRYSATAALVFVALYMLAVASTLGASDLEAQPHHVNVTSGSIAPDHDDLQEVIARHHEQLVEALEHFKLRYGSYPTSLTDLRTSGVVVYDASAPRLRGEHATFYYRISEDGYVLLPPKR